MHNLRLSFLEIILRSPYKKEITGEDTFPLEKILYIAIIWVIFLT
jgi:hypothetical protein